MARPFVLLFALFLSSPVALAQKPGLIEEGDSPQDDLHYTVRQETKDEVVQHVFLSPADPQTGEVELCANSGAFIKINFSPNENWILTTQGGASLGTDFRLFKRTDKLHYAEQTSADIADNAERMIWRLNHKDPAQSRLDHRYLSLLAWSADSASILIGVSGHGDHKHIDSWVFIYDIGTGRFSFDLSRIDRHAVTFNP